MALVPPKLNKRQCGLCNSDQLAWQGYVTKYGTNLGGLRGITLFELGDVPNARAKVYIPQENQSGGILLKF
jgi:hypothetical protein